MKTALNVLIVEDSPHDAELFVRELRRGGFDPKWQRVDNSPDLIAALQRKVDVVLSDYTMPHFDGLSALKICRELSPDVPYIFVSGTMGEERAVESLQNGATDYVLKDRLIRLLPAVRRALREIDERAARKSVEEQFAQAQKMEVVGRLAGSVAHDFNNILTVILGYTQSVLAQVGLDHPAHNHAQEVTHAAKHGVELTRQLLSFSRKQPFKPGVLNLGKVVVEMNHILARLLDEDVELKIVEGKDLRPVEADAGYISQILLNLVVNARDAMPQGGKVLIETSNARFDKRQPPDLFDPPLAGAYVVLTVRDTGMGMSDEVKAHLFEPFFTTKSKGEGTGLGLATCQKMVTQCGGHIDVQSKINHGTTVRVCLPQSNQKLSEPAACVAAGPPPRGTETLLLVEDEPSVRRLATDVLKALGYKVLSASDGEEGLNAAQTYPDGPIHLAIADVVMPRMGGKDMAAWLKATFPEMKILYTSGYTDDAIVRHGDLDAGVEFLAKPYLPDTLARKVREILDRKTTNQNK
ncbi:MAG TPA: response regulator [Verrucomicrobiae bacterium]|jgi:signal transduction histidine kinase|nr:response regulator [Verrucomicrobiae bacterium]